MSLVFHILDWLLFILAGIPVLYFAVFTVAALFRKKESESVKQANGKMVILIPAYRCDAVIGRTVEAAVRQDFGDGLSNRVIVIADGLSEGTCAKVKSLGAEVLIVSFENSSKAKSLNFAIDYLGDDAADWITVLDADNIVGTDYVSRLASALSEDYKAVQAHRAARNRNTPTAVIDAASEEINNTIFRLGHNALDLPSALIGSGMAFDYDWFRNHISKCSTAGEDKELELMLLREKVHIKYLDDVVVLDEKTSGVGSYSGQRRRWISAQFYSLVSALRNFPETFNVGYLDKILQWMFLPRMVIVALIPIMAVICLLVCAVSSVKWFALALLLSVTLFVALPAEQRDRKLLKALSSIPALSASAFSNMFRMRGNKNVFIHTEHNVSGNE